MRLVWEDDAWEDYLYWQTQDKKMLKRVNALIKDIRRSTFEGIGKPEPLKHNLSGWWSRRIDDINRIVYYGRDGLIILSPAGATMIEGVLWLSKQHLKNVVQLHRKRLKCWKGQKICRLYLTRTARN